MGKAPATSDDLTIQTPLQWGVVFRDPAGRDGAALRSGAQLVLSLFPISSRRPLRDRISPQLRSVPYFSGELGARTKCHISRSAAHRAAPSQGPHTLSRLEIKPDAGDIQRPDPRKYSLVSMAAHCTPTLR